MIAMSFNSGSSRARFEGFSFSHYAEMLKDEMMLNALKNTLIIALFASVVATIIGTFAAFAIGKMSPFMKSSTIKILNIPMLNAEIVTGISLMLFFVFASIPLGFFSLLIAHTMFNVPYVTMSVLPKIRQLNKSTYEAALDLGASPLRAFRKIVLPEIMPGILSGALLAFTLSLDDFIISYFTSGSDFMTLSVYINSMTKKSIPLSVNALSTIMFTVVFVLLLIVNLKKPAKEKE
ncbi:MAG: ABC transporter permease [Clostridia bacterium]|nr:ABC transporter permease [Clostridia bacterium]